MIAKLAVYIETMLKTRRTSFDRFSNLPDHVAHNVLSFLSMEDISRLCVVSKRCRQLCISIPILNVDSRRYGNNATKRSKLASYLDRFLLLRKGMEIQRCFLRWFLSNSLFDDQYRILSWLHNAVNCNAELLDVEISFEREANFPLQASLLCCESLRFLKVSLLNGILKFPSSITTFGFSSLQTLSMKSVEINESFGKWVSLYCKFLKDLSLENIKGTKSINITSSSLEILKILSPGHDVCHVNVSAESLLRMALRWRFDSPNNRVLQLSAPKLICFFWEGNISNFSFKGDFAHLVTAGIFFRTPSESSSLITQSLLGVLRGLGNTKVVALHDKCIQVLFKQGCLPTLFVCLSTLYVFTSGISDELVLALPFLLAGAPNLRRLFICSKFMSGYLNGIKEVHRETVGCWELQDLIFIRNLKSVTIELISEGRNELELIKHLLKHATNLQRMTVFYAPSLQSDVIRRISQYEKASDAQLIFHYKAFDFC
ncbi:hypothetical protein UlMin_005184, partial [Ulmus minor]